MKNLFKPIYQSVLYFICFFFLFQNGVYANNSSDTLVTKIYQETALELAALDDVYAQKLTLLQQQLDTTNFQLRKIVASDTPAILKKVDALIKLQDIKDAIKIVEEEYQIELYKIRYRKGIEMIKLIYEKVLGLDHHFTSLQTFQNISTLSNPNSFPEFTKMKEVLSKKMSKKQAIRLPALLETNPYVSMTFSLVSSFFGGGEKKTREHDLEKIACIMDFTVRMSSDLKTIYYETEFLKENNRALKEESIKLFKDYVKVIGYKVPLQDCRKEDDWEVVYKLLDEYIFEMKENGNNIANHKEMYSQQVNIVFSIDRLMQFMDKYSAFISSGEKYYQKFQTILNNYSNEEVCQEQLPHQFNDLKRDIELSILKFNEAYNISELQGSKLKDLMYGIKD